MYRSNSPKIVPVIVVIVIIIALIAGLVALGRLFFGGTAQQSQQVNQQKSAQQALLTVDDNHSLKMVVRGPIVADENFRSYEIDIAPSLRSYTIYKGYLGTVESTKNLDNNAEAYKQFVNALDKAALTRTSHSTDQTSDILGICATGNVYEFSIMNGSTAAEYYWTSTCSGSKGTFGANINQVTNLFVNQIPDLKNTFVSNSLRF